jgi:hypothetical protein
MPRRYTGGFLSSKEQATDANTANGIFTTQEAAALTTAGNFPTGRWTPQRSLRFKSASNTYLRRTPSTTGNRKTFTHSVWFKLGMLSSTLIIFEASDATGTSVRSPFRMTSGGNLQWTDSSSGAVVNSAALLRDPSAWYHAVVAVDTTQTISTERVKMYINGVRQTSFETYTAATLNSDTLFNSSSYFHTIGSGIYWTAQAFDGYMSEFNHIDGQALDPSYFGATDPETGTWVPKRYTGTYGTNGFYLPFNDNTTTYSLGKNASGFNNLLSYTEQLDNAYWTKSATTVSANSVANPLDGATNADTVLESATTAAHYIQNASAVTKLANGTYSFSVYAKAAGQTTIALQLSESGGGYMGSVFDLSAGTAYVYTGIGMSPADGTNHQTITPVGNGWYRCSVNVTTGSPTNITAKVSLGGYDASYAGNASNGVYLWGMQINAGSVPLQYASVTTSPVSNDWTPNNISVTAGTTNDSMVDVPGIASVTSQRDVGGVQRGNYCTLNPLSYFGTGASGASGNLTLNITTAGGNLKPTMGVTSGKYYSEFTIGSIGGATGTNFAINVSTCDSSSTIGIVNAVYYVNGQSYNYATASFVSYGASYTTNDIIGVAIDCDNFEVTFYKNGVSQGVQSAGAIRATPGGAPVGIIPTTSGGSSTTTVHCNFGQRPFAYTPPTGFKSICTTNLPNSIIKRPSDHFDVKTWTGNGTALTIGNTQKQTQAHPVSNSILFSSRSGTSLYRTPTSNGSPVVATFSAWIKPTWSGSPAESQVIFAAGISTSFQATLYIGTDRSLNTYVADNGIVRNSMSTIQKIPTNTWTHIQWVYQDATATGQSDRSRLYINGTRAIITGSPTFPGGNVGFVLNNTSYPNVLGKSSFQAAAYYTGYMAEVNYVDGSALEPSSFGQFDASNNWMPIRYTGTYSTNGFYLPFSDIRNDTTIGYDSSGNSNHFSSPFGLTVLPTALTSPNVLYYGTPGSYTWTAPAGVTSVNYLVVAGGGGGGAAYGGGGGAGGMLTGTLSVTPSTSYTVTVGAGGGGGNGAVGGQGTAGSNSVFASITATGGGSGGFTTNNGGNGGSGGGGGGTSGAGGSGTGGQGSAGGSGTSNSSGGGGGAGQAGNVRGQSYGGNGLTSAITGVATYYAGGGSGRLAAGGSPGIHGGGLGGGGASTSYNLSFGTPGTGGGGGGTNDSSNGGTGGSGVVILSYTNAGSYIGTGANKSIYQSNVIDAPVDGIDSSNLPHGNYAILDSTNRNSNHTIWDGLNITSSSYGAAAATFGVSSGKWYYEATIINRTSNNSGGIGWCNDSYAVATQTYLTDTANSFGINAINGNAAYNAANTAHGSAFSSGDVIMCAIDVDAKKAYFGKNGTWFSSSNPVTGASTFPYAFTGTTFYPAVNAYGDTYEFNFGQQPFSYTIPSGFNPINTKSLKDFGSSNLPDTFGNFVNTPDMVWLKSRSGAYDHQIADTVRGPRRGLKPNTTALDAAEANGVQSFNPNGFQVLGAQDFNNAGSTYAAWAWNRGRTPGFDIVNYGGTGAVQHVPHNLGQQPGFMMIKATGGASAQQWRIWHNGIATANYFLSLPDTGYGTADANIFPNPPSNSTFTVGSGNSAGGTGYSYIAYLWAEVPGFSKIGTYTGNSSANGPFVYCGFKPRFILARQLTTGYGWIIIDTERSKNNPASVWVNPDGTTVEGSPAAEFYDILSNGFKLRYSGAFNTSGASHAYVAFAENPFKYATAR